MHNWDNLLDDYCPICGAALQFNINGRYGAYYSCDDCDFTINEEKADDLKDKIEERRQ